jgi:hypothetical protein
LWLLLWTERNFVMGMDRAGNVKSIFRLSDMVAGNTGGAGTTTMSDIFHVKSFSGTIGGMTSRGAEVVVPSIFKATPTGEVVEEQQYKALVKKVSSFENQVLGFRCRIDQLLEQLQAKDDRIAEQDATISEMTTGACRELFGIEFLVKPCDDHWVWEVFHADGYSTTFGNAANEVKAVAMALMAYEGDISAETDEDDIKRRVASQ